MMAIDAVPFRKPDRRTEADDLRVELAARRDEELIYIRRTWEGSMRAFRLIEGGRLVEAQSMIGGLVHASNRRMTQLRNGGDAA